jgi:calcium-dependent protein kinase
LNNNHTTSAPTSRVNEERYRYFDRFSTTDIRTIYVLETIIGGGHFGSVYSAYAIGDKNRKYAIKTITKSKISDRSLKRLEQELDILASLDHPNLVKYYATYTDKQHIHIVMELCQGGEVFEKIQ